MILKEPVFSKYILSKEASLSPTGKKKSKQKLQIMDFVLKCSVLVLVYIGGTFPTTAGFQDSDFFQKAIKMVLRYILSVIFHLSEFNFNLVPPMACSCAWGVYGQLKRVCVES